MGYEIKLYFVESYEHIKGTVENPAFNSVVGMIDLCKLGGDKVQEYITQRIQTTKLIGQRNYFYADDGDTKITHDRYDDPVAELEPEIMLELLEEEHRINPYRRFEIAIAFIKAAVKGFENRLKIFSYGH